MVREGDVEWRRWDNFCGKEGERVKMVEIFVEIAAIFVALFGTIHIMNVMRSSVQVCSPIAPQQWSFQISGHYCSIFQTSTFPNFKADWVEVIFSSPTVLPQTLDTIS